MRLNSLLISNSALDINSASDRDSSLAMKFSRLRVFSIYNTVIDIDLMSGLCSVPPAIQGFEPVRVANSVRFSLLIGLTKSARDEIGRR
jgi:hypothetical protein